MTNASDLVAWLRAAGEPTRLRLLALCAERELSVSDLAVAVGQSGPRVSRHLKILCAAGLLARLRCGQWVHYRLARDPAAARFLSVLVADLDPADPLLARDRGRIKATRTQPDDEASTHSRLDQALASFITTSAGAGREGSALVVGVEHHAMLASAIAVAHDCTAIAHGRRAEKAARAFLKHKDLSCRMVLASAAGEPIGSELVQAGPQFAALVLDRLAGHAAPLAEWLAAGRRVLAPGGRLWLFERAESLPARPEGGAGQPLVRLRQLLDQAGFACERLSPIQADREHILAAVAVPGWAVRAASVA